MTDLDKPKLTRAQQVLTWLGTVLVGLGALVLVGVGATLHPLFGRPVVGWVLMVAGFTLSAGVSVSVVLKARRR